MGWCPFRVQLQLEYQNGHDNMVADILSQVTTWLDLETVKSILDGVTFEMVHCVKIHDPAMVEDNQHLEQEVCITTCCPLVEMHVTKWAKAQREKPMWSAGLDWLKAQKQADLKALLAEHVSSEEDKLILWNQLNFTIYQGPCTYAQCWKAKPKICCSLWSPRHTVLPLSMVPPRCRLSRMQLYPVFVAGMLLVVRYGQPGAEFPKVLHVLLVAWGQFV